jgi:hypothetical protein
LYLAVPQNATGDWEQWAWLYEENVVTFKNNTEDNAQNCTLVYKLYLEDGGVYRPWETIKAEINEQIAPEQVHEGFWMDQTRPNLSVSFPESIITLLRARFGNEINVRIYAIIGGSQRQGPLQELSELEYGQFKVIMLEDNLVKECEKNTFIN